MKRTIEHAFYDDGRIYQEVPFVGDTIDGALREWHPNGLLAWEVPHRKGLKHGVCKQWNDQGVLLGTYEAKNGTGPSKCWHPNGQLKLEMFTIRGVPNGPVRKWNEAGALLDETFYIDGRKVSEEEYQRACRQTPVLPRC